MSEEKKEDLAWATWNMTDVGILLTQLAARMRWCRGKFSLTFTSNGGALTQEVILSMAFGKGEQGQMNGSRVEVTMEGMMGDITTMLCHALAIADTMPTMEKRT